MDAGSSRLCIRNLECNQSGLRELCEKYGKLLDFCQPKDKNYAFVQYESLDIAKAAIVKIKNFGYRVDYAFGRDHNKIAKTSLCTRTSDCGLEMNGHRKSSETSPLMSDCSDNNELSDFGECIKCLKRSYLKCERCHDFYCSAECQKQDWQAHRYICLPMPRLIRANSRSNDLRPIKSQKPMPEKSVTVSPVKEPVIKNTLQVRIESSKGRLVAPRPLNSVNKEAVDCTKNDDARVDVPEPTAANRFTRSLENKQVEAIKTPATQCLPKSPARRLELPKSEVKTTPPTKLLDESVQTETPSVQPVKQESKEPVKTEVTAPKPVIQEKKASLDVSEIKNGDRVILTYPVNNCTVFIRAASQHADYCEVLEKVAEAAKTAPALSKLPSRHDMVIAPYEGEYFRGLVVSAPNEDNISIGFIDFGNQSIVPCNALKKIPEDLENAKRFTTKVILKNVSKDKRTDAVDLLSRYADLHELIVKFDPNAYIKDVEVELFDSKTNKSLNEEVIQFVNAKNKANTVSPEVKQDKQEKQEMQEKQEKQVKQVTAPKENQMFTEEMVKNKKLNGENCELIIVENTSLLYNNITCLAKSDQQKFMEKDKELQQYCIKFAFDQPQGAKVVYTPQLDELCLLRDLSEEDPYYYRVLCTGIENDGFKVYLIDFGSEMLAQPKDLRRFTADCAYENLSLLCAVEGVNVGPQGIEDKAVLRKLQNMFDVGTQITVESIRYVEDQGYHVIKTAIN